MKIVRLLPVLLFAVASHAGAATDSGRLLSREQLGELIQVRDVTSADDGTVAGTVVNRSTFPVRDVRLRVEHLWLWDNERHPGTDDRSRSDTYTVPGEIPAGASRSFTYRPTAILEPSEQGRYTVVVEPLEVTEMVEPGTVNARSRAASPYGGARPSDVPPPAEVPPPPAEPSGGTMTDEPIRPPY